MGLGFFIPVTFSSRWIISFEARLAPVIALCDIRFPCDEFCVGVVTWSIFGISQCMLGSGFYL